MQQFYSLTPERMLDEVETALSCDGRHARSTGRWLALNSMENRVYDIELEDGSHVVSKFYRPGRWTREAILDEHRFIEELVEAEVPAVAPLALASGSTLATSTDGIHFAVFPKVRGQILQELSDDQLAQIGRFVARLHNVGTRHDAPHRLRITPTTYGWESLEFLESSGLLDAQAQPRYRAVVTEILKRIEPMFAGLLNTATQSPSAWHDTTRVQALHRIHGDCHLGNVLWFRAGPSFVDFDDMLVGPAVQDIWMIVRGRDAEAQRQRDVLLKGYEQMRAFEYSTLKLIEPLRALRIIHYSAWIARRWEDPSFKNAFPTFGTLRYWQDEIQDLSEQLAIVADLQV